VLTGGARSLALTPAFLSFAVVRGNTAWNGAFLASAWQEQTVRFRPHLLPSGSISNLPGSCPSLSIAKSPNDRAPMMPIVSDPIGFACIALNVSYVNSPLRDFGEVGGLLGEYNVQASYLGVRRGARLWCR